MGVIRGKEFGDGFSPHLFVQIRRDFAVIDERHFFFLSDLLRPDGHAPPAIFQHLSHPTFDAIVGGGVVVLLVDDRAIAKGGVGVGPDISHRRG